MGFSAVAGTVALVALHDRKVAREAEAGALRAEADAREARSVAEQERDKAEAARVVKRKQPGTMSFGRPSPGCWTRTSERCPLLSSN